MVRRLRVVLVTMKHGSPRCKILCRMLAKMQCVGMRELQTDEGRSGVRWTI